MADSTPTSVGSERRELNQTSVSDTSTKSCTASKSTVQDVLDQNAALAASLSRSEAAQAKAETMADRLLEQYAWVVMRAFLHPRACWSLSSVWDRRDGTRLRGRGNHWAHNGETWLVLRAVVRFRGVYPWLAGLVAESLGLTAGVWLREEDGRFREELQDCHYVDLTIQWFHKLPASSKPGHGPFAVSWARWRGIIESKGPLLTEKYLFIGTTLAGTPSYADACKGNSTPRDTEPHHQDTETPRQHGNAPNRGPFSVEGEALRVSQVYERLCASVFDVQAGQSSSLHETASLFPTATHTSAAGGPSHRPTGHHLSSAAATASRLVAVSSPTRGSFLVTAAQFREETRPPRLGAAELLRLLRDVDGCGAGVSPASS